MSKNVFPKQSTDKKQKFGVGHLAVNLAAAKGRLVKGDKDAKPSQGETHTSEKQAQTSNYKSPIIEAKSLVNKTFYFFQTFIFLFVFRDYLSYFFLLLVLFSVPFSFGPFFLFLFF